MLSRIHQNFHRDCEQYINGLINISLYASYVHFAGALYFNKEDVALKHFEEFFRKRSREKREVAEKYSLYLQRRGGRISLFEIRKPNMDDWTSSLGAINSILKTEKIMNAAVLKSYQIALEKADPHFCRLLKSFLDDEMTIIKCLEDFMTKLKHLGSRTDKTGEYLLDKHMLGASSGILH